MRSGALAFDYNSNEKWEFFEKDGKRWARVTGRVRVPKEMRDELHEIVGLDPNEQWIDDGTTDWYMKKWPRIIRVIFWNFRNSVSSRLLATVVLGVQDRNYTVEVTEGNFNEPLLIQRNDYEELGTQRATLHLDDGTKRYWWSYCNRWVTTYFGCQPNGLFAAKWNFPTIGWMFRK